MALIKTVRGWTPKIGKNCFLAENATIVGDVKIGDDCSIWFNTVIRGDVNWIKIGNKVNIQDGAVLHTLYEKSTIEIGDSVSIGHNAVIHGAKIHDRVLVGIDQMISPTIRSNTARSPLEWKVYCGSTVPVFNPPSSSKTRLTC